jgi:hypothetical protein
MRYFTKEMYEKMQVSGYLSVAPHINEQIEESKEWYITQGRDFRSEVQQQFLHLKPLLLKYVPESKELVCQCICNVSSTFHLATYEVNI